jgi:hypothetical protein
VEELLRKLAALEARGQDVLDEVDIKTVGLDKPAGTVMITLEENDKAAKSEDKEPAKKKRTIELRLGQKQNESDKLYVRVAPWPRVNRVDGEVWKLVNRTDLAYLSRSLWQLDRDDLRKISIKTDAGAYDL